MVDDSEKIKSLERYQLVLEEEQENLKHEQDHLKQELHQKGKEIYSKIDRIEGIAVSNSKKLDAIQSLIDQTKGGLKFLGKVIDASIIISFFVTMYLAMFHGIKSFFHKL